MTTTASPTPAEIFRSTLERANFTIVGDDVPDDLTREQVIELLQDLIAKIDAQDYAAGGTAPVIPTLNRQPYGAGGFEVD